MDESKEEKREEGGRPAEGAARKRRIATALTAIALALLFFAVGWFAHWLSLGGKGRSLLWAIRTAEREYYREVDEEKLYDDLFDVLSLDPYSEYYTRAEYKAVLGSNEGKGADTGISVLGDPLRVMRVVGGSPAERAGLSDGMYILRMGAEETSLAAGDLAALQALVAAHPEKFFLECATTKEGTDAKVYALSSGDYRVSYCEYRDAEGSFRADPAEELSLRGTDRPLALPEHCAYIRIDRFYGTAAEEFERLLSLMKERGKSDLVIDLRLNGGGYLSVFQDIAANLLRNADEARPVVAYARSRSGKEERYRAPKNNFSKYFSADSKVYILADENTASASECLIGALVSYGTVPYENIFLRKEGKVAKTYGKGIMQSSFTDPEGNVLKLTVAEIYWPNGTSIHGKGVVEADGAAAVEAPMLPEGSDLFLGEVCARLS